MRSPSLSAVSRRVAGPSCGDRVWGTASFPSAESVRLLPSFLLPIPRSPSLTFLRPTIFVFRISNFDFRFPEARPPRLRACPESSERVQWYALLARRGGRNPGGNRRLGEHHGRIHLLRRQEDRHAARGGQRAVLRRGFSGQFLAGGAIELSSLLRRGGRPPHARLALRSALQPRSDFGELNG